MNNSLRIGIGLLVFLLLVAFVGPYLPFVDHELKEVPFLMDEDKNIITVPVPPSKEYPLGTDHLGRDLLTLLLDGLFQLTNHLLTNPPTTILWINNY